MGTIRNGVLLSILALGIGLAPAYAEHEPDTTGRPAPNLNFRPNAKLRSIEELKTFLNSVPPKGEAWWAAAHEALEVLGAQAIKDKEAGKDPKDPMDWAKELGSPEQPERQLAFEAVVTANRKDQTELKELAHNVKDQSPLGIAARYEMAWRLKDPHVKFVSQYFSRRPESAIEDAMQLINLAKTGPDKLTDDQAAAIANQMMSLINKQQRTTLRDALVAIKATNTNAEKPELYENPALYKEVVSKLLEAVEVTLDRAKAENGNDYQKKFAKLYEQTLIDNAAFHALVQSARGGDDNAIKKLRASYKDEDLMDFIGGQIKTNNDGVAVGLAQIVAEKKTPDGPSVLTLARSNSAFANNTDPMTVHLGKADEEVRAALQAIYNTSANALNPGAILFQPDYNNGLELVTISRTAAPEGTPRYFADPLKPGKLVETKDGAPAKLASQLILAPLPKPPPRTEEPKPQPDGNQNPPGKQPEETQPPAADDATKAAARVAAVEAQLGTNRCNKCHDASAGETAITASGTSVNPARILELANESPELHKGSEKRTTMLNQLKAFVESQAFKEWSAGQAKPR